ncbi:hypothetical protein DY000_02032136 [Brassica cretica]|uniref:Uncharacterized protein n=1 Tax=Brassica cretica TaxID=69181 RepID=A0ABQ7DT59_BRACR|nr:hypothetical protein DY000_02032136 [Brassica cretica]
MHLSSSPALPLNTSQPPQQTKYSVLSSFSTRLTRITTTVPSDDASCSDVLGAMMCQRKILILVGLMGLGLATGSPSRPPSLVYPPSHSPKILSCGLVPQFPPSVSISSFVVSNSIMEREMMLGSAGSITDSSFSWDFAASSQTYSLGSINLVYDYVKLVGAFVFSGIQVKIIHGLLHIEQVSPANIHILCFSVLSLLFSLPLRLTLGFIVLPSSMAPVVTI